MSESITYFFPGMGANTKMYYQQKRLPFDKHFFDWIPPNKGETLSSYAGRYIEMMDLNRPINLVGVSFGGVMVNEIANQIEVDKLILISSMSNIGDLGFGLRIFKYLPLYKLIPPKRPPLNRKIISKVFGISSEKELDFFVEMISEFDFKYIKWCVSQLMEWGQRAKNPKAISIIGDKDLLFRKQKNSADIIIHGGTHYMIIERHREINDHLKEIIVDSDNYSQEGAA